MVGWVGDIIGFDGRIRINGWTGMKGGALEEDGDMVEFVLVGSDYLNILSLIEDPRIEKGKNVQGGFFDWSHPEKF